VADALSPDGPGPREFQLRLDPLGIVERCSPAATRWVEAGAPLPPAIQAALPIAAARAAGRPLRARVELPGVTEPVLAWCTPAGDALWVTAELPDPQPQHQTPPPPPAPSVEAPRPRQLGLIFDAAPVLQATFDCEGRFVQANPRWADIVGWTPDELVGAQAADFVHPEDRQAAEAAGRAQISAQGSPVHAPVTVRFQRKPGGWAHLAWTFWHDPSHGLVFGVAVDRATQPDLPSAILERTTNAVVVTDTDGRITWVNPGFTLLSGYTLAEARGHRPYELLNGPDTDAETLGRIIERLAAGGSITTDVQAHHKSGHAYWTRLNVQPLRDPEGQLIGHMSIETDITETRRMLAELEAANRRAEELAASAQEASSAKSRFLASMSHELRTPMNQVLGAAQLLAQTGLDRGQQGLLKTLDDAAKGLLALLNDLLDFADQDDEQLMLHRSTVDPRAVARSTVDHLSAEAHHRDLHLTLDLAPSLPDRLELDELRFRQLLLNLMRSGLDNTDEGGVSLALRWDDSKGLRILVADTGGNPASGPWQLLRDTSEHRDRAPAPSHLDARELGLFVALRIVQSMGGSVGTETTPGIGTTVWVDLPVGTAAEDPSLGVEPVAVQAAAGPHVLLVEDNPINRKVAQQMLRSLGCTVDSAEDGEQALRALEQHRYAVVFMDCQMPVLDGWEATLQLRERERSQAQPRVPVVAVTASSRPAEVNRCYAVGMDEVMVKPVGLQHYAACLERWARERERRA
jgi:PAS domain S-box-containing protein